MVNSDLRPEVVIWPFRACTMKNMQYNRYYRNSSVIVDLAMGRIPRSTERISSILFMLLNQSNVLRVAVSMSLTTVIY